MSCPEDAPVKLDLADEAILFSDKCDGRTKVRLLRRGRFALDASAWDADSSRRLAEVALERLPR